jgi:outer membrane protein assembly factor BamB
MTVSQLWCGLAASLLVLDCHGSASITATATDASRRPDSTIASPDGGRGDAQPAEAGDDASGSEYGADAQADADAGPSGPPPPFGPSSVLIGHLHPTRDGAFVAPQLTKAAASAMKLAAGFQATYDGQTYSQPLYVENLRAGQDAVFIATQTNEVAAFDATTGATLWSVTLGPIVKPSTEPCHQSAAQPYGILSTPVIDEGSRSLFTEAFIATGDGGLVPKHLVYALSIDTGAVRPGWPVDIAAVVTGFNSSVQHERGAPLIVGGVLYLPFSGIGYDCEPPDYRGRVVGISIVDPTQVSAWTTTANRGGVWGAITSDGTSLFFATGNTGPDASTWGGGEAVLRLGTNLVFAGDTTSYFAPSNWQALDQGDLDLGSSSLVLFDLPGAVPSTLAVAMGKAGTVHLVDRTNLGGIGTGDGAAGEGLYSGQVVQGSLAGNPATYVTAQGRYVVFNTPASASQCADGGGGNLIALKITATAPPTFSVAWCATSQGLGSPMVTTTDGQSNPIVWVTSAQKTNLLLGFDGDTGEQVFAGGGVTMSEILRWTSPIVAKGRMFVGATQALYAFDVP